MALPSLEDRAVGRTNGQSCTSAQRDTPIARLPPLDENPPEPSREPQRRKHLAALDAYRGLAALAIVIFHAVLEPTVELNGTPFLGHVLRLVLLNLDMAVDWFFVLSGFLLFLPFAEAAVAQSPQVSVRGFLIRRSLRILPAYYVALLVVWIARYQGPPGEWEDLIRHLTFTHVFDDRYARSTIGPAWSLAVEWYFYLSLGLIGPLAHWACAWLPTVRARKLLLAGFLAACGAASLLYRCYIFQQAGLSNDSIAKFFAFGTRMDGLALGMGLALAIAVVPAQRLFRSASTLRRLRIGGVLLMVCIPFLPMLHSPVWVLSSTLSAIGFTLVLASSVLASPAQSWDRALRNPVCQYLGTISYGMYLWHLPVMEALIRHGFYFRHGMLGMAANVLASVLIAIALGIVGYVAIERPTMRLRRYFTRDGRLLRVVSPVPSPMIKHG